METNADIEAQPLVSLTENAAAHVRTLLSEQSENAGKVLRIYVESGGCSGMQYGMVFDELRPDDVVGESFGVSVLVDPFSADYLAGTVVDYVDALTGGGFKISNPKAQHSCGCGKSFEAQSES
ncbi:MAG: iron-sulfur cluster assembly accessory protein [Verrucomicrobia subdivision 3 bacterium]|nr:iron-sulfur cluster assembly accessory protein [Limisphaerales bacterium]